MTAGETSSRVVLVYGCPGRSDLSFLAQAATTEMASNLPSSASGFAAVLEYEGINCARKQFGEATFDAATAKLTLRQFEPSG